MPSLDTANGDSAPSSTSRSRRPTMATVAVMPSSAAIVISTMAMPWSMSTCPPGAGPHRPDERGTAYLSRSSPPITRTAYGSIATSAGVRCARDPATDPVTIRLSDEQRALRDAVRQLADERIAPRAAAIDASGEFPWDVVELLAAQDVLALPYPVSHGGLGGELLTVCLAVEQVSRVCATSGLILVVQELGSLPLLLAGTPEQQARWFPDLAAGRALAAFALTESEAGSDAAAIRTRAVRDGEGWRLDGAKRFISQGNVGRCGGHRPGRPRGGHALRGRAAPIRQGHRRALDGGGDAGRHGHAHRSRAPAPVHRLRGDRGGLAGGGPPGGGG